MSLRRVGISGIAAYVPRLYLDLGGAWAEARTGSGSADSLRRKVTQGIGIRRVAMPDFHEDPVTMAANAVVALIENTGIDPADIGSIAVGTESSPDLSKSAAAYVLGLIARHYRVDLSRTSAPHFQFACIGATYALEAALTAVAAGTAVGKHHIVVATDVARYPVGSVGEPTQGAGAVAMLVNDEPAVLEIDVGAIGTCTVDERDFYRPVGLKTPIVDGKRSVSVYCDTIARAAQHARERRGGDLLFDSFGAYVFHLPFPKMAEYAAARLFRILWKSDAARAPLAAGLDGEAAEDLAFRRDPAFRAVFEERVRPSTLLAEQIGNVYAGSLWLALLSLVEARAEQGLDLGGTEVLLASFGSGASAKVLCGRFVEGYTRACQLGLLQSLRDEREGGRRRGLTMEEYERLHARAELRVDAAGSVEILPLPSSIVPPRGEFYLRGIGDGRSEDASDLGYRYYDHSNDE